MSVFMCLKEFSSSFIRDTGAFEVVAELVHTVERPLRS